MKMQIVIPCINLWAKYTRSCVDSLNAAMAAASARGVETRLLLIDNASTDETSKEASKIVSDVFGYQRNEERWGFQKSVNFGVNDAWTRGCDMALVCNNDIVMHPEAILRLAEGFVKVRTSLDVGLITCMNVRREVDEKKIEPKNVGALLARDKEGLGVTPHPDFSAFALSRRCWKEVGEFDEIFAPAYFEDNDYHYRIKLAGMDAITYPPAMFYHYGSRTLEEASENGKRTVTSEAFNRNRAMYGMKWGGRPGGETYTTPYDEAMTPITATKQSQA
jgi:GT2 family glycosyltransferase